MMGVKKLSIPDPCHQSWQQMTAVDGGRHCDSCCKTVVDFTKMTNDQIINYLSVSHKVCGRIHEHQMNGINLQLAAAQSQNKGGWAKWVVAAVLFVSTAYNRASAQSTAQPTEQVSGVVRQNTGVTLGKIAPPDTSQYKTITGIIVAGDDKLPIAGATIKGDSKNATAVSDINGQFKIRVPKATKNLKISYVGYETTAVEVSETIKPLKVVLKTNSVALGGLGFTRTSLIQRLHAGFINRLSSGKLNREI